MCYNNGTYQQKDKNMKEELQRKNVFMVVYGVETMKEVLLIFRADYKSIKNVESTKSESLQLSINLFQRYLLAITYLYSISSIKNNLKLFKAIIKKEGGEFSEIALKVFHIGGGKDEKIPSIYSTVSAKTEEKIIVRENQDNSNKLDVKKEIKRVKELLNNKSYSVRHNQDEKQVRSYHIAYLLGLGGGRRFAEILKTATIKTVRGKYIYSGILKKDVNDKTVIEVNLIGLTIDEYKTYNKELRMHLNKKLKAQKKTTLKIVTEAQINTLFSKVYNNAVKRISGDKVPNFHELRHYFTIEGTTLFKRKGESDRETRYRILGHAVKSDSTRTYATTK
jgi:integrase